MFKDTKTLSVHDALLIRQYMCSKPIFFSSVFSSWRQLEREEVFCQNGTAIIYEKFREGLEVVFAFFDASGLEPHRDDS